MRWWRWCFNSSMRAWIARACNRHSCHSNALGDRIGGSGGVGGSGCSARRRGRQSRSRSLARCGGIRRYLGPCSSISTAAQATSRVTDVRTCCRVHRVDAGAVAAKDRIGVCARWERGHKPRVGEIAWFPGLAAKLKLGCKTEGSTTKQTERKSQIDEK
jgi:hypothetical protein